MEGRLSLLLLRTGPQADKLRLFDRGAAGNLEPNGHCQLAAWRCPELIFHRPQIADRHLNKKETPRGGRGRPDESRKPTVYRGSTGVTLAPLMAPSRRYHPGIGLWIEHETPPLARLKGGDGGPNKRTITDG